MRRVAPAMPVSSDVLKHFAVLTLVITAGIAMFANGENRNALSEQVRQRQMETAALRAARDKATQHTVVIDGLRVAPGTRLAAADVGDDYRPTETIVPAESLPMADFAPQGVAGPVGPAATGPGGTARDGKGGAVPPPAMNMRLRGKPGQPRSAASHAPPSEQDINALIQASAQRAGRPSVE